MLTRDIAGADALNIHPANIRAKVRQQFEKNSKIDDLETVDVLLLKGHQEFQETMNVWKMESHVVSVDLHSLDMIHLLDLRQRRTRRCGSSEKKRRHLSRLLS